MESFSTVIAGYIAYAVSNKTLDSDLRLHGWRAAESERQSIIFAPSAETLIRMNDNLKDILENKDCRKTTESFSV
jgi:hypothetical protein